MLDEPKNVIPFSKRRIRNGEGVKFTSKCVEALDAFWRLVDRGMDRTEAEALLAAGLKAALPNTAVDDQDYRDVCARCDGSGMYPVMKWTRIYQAEARYVRHCECSLGQRLKNAAEQSRLEKDFRVASPSELSKLAKTSRY